MQMLYQLTGSTTGWDFIERLSAVLGIASFVFALVAAILSWKIWKRLRGRSLVGASASLSWTEAFEKFENMSGNAALSINLAPKGSAETDIRAFYEGQNKRMPPFFEIRKKGVWVSDPKDTLGEVLSELATLREEMTEKGVMGVDLFYWGPNGAEALIGAALKGWKTVRVHHHKSRIATDGTESPYEYWGTLPI